MDADIWAIPKTVLRKLIGLFLPSTSPAVWEIPLRMQTVRTRPWTVRWKEVKHEACWNRSSTTWWPCAPWCRCSSSPALIPSSIRGEAHFTVLPTQEPSLLMSRRKRDFSTFCVSWHPACVSIQLDLRTWSRQFGWPCIFFHPKKKTLWLTRVHRLVSQQ